jgi:tRNA A37 methylthiotransferase MiaB
MPQLDGRVIRHRADEIRAHGTARLEASLDNAVGSHDQLLVESGNAGHGRNFAKMRLEGDMESPGTLVDVTVLARDGQHLKVVRR